MNAITPAETPHLRLVFFLSLLITLLMGILYTALDVLQPPDPYRSLFAFIPGTTSLLVLRAAGSSRSDLNFRMRWISIPGIGALAATTFLLLPILGSSTSWVGFNWISALVYAPASGIAQELYFRSSLLSGLERFFKNRKTIPLLVHSVFFVAFHFRTFQSIPSLPIALVVILVLFLAGCGWGWQVQRDRTVVWAALHHSFFLVLMSMFDWA
jgi:hypothetical protein